MRVVVTGAQGFLGRNLIAHLERAAGVVIIPITRSSTGAELGAALEDCDLVFHLAGVNRPKDEAEFDAGNTEFTEAICRYLSSCGSRAAVVFASSIQAERDTPYGVSKRRAEEHLLALARASGNSVHIYRLPNVFGKWSRPNYNSAIATFCHNLARGLPIRIDNPDAAVRLVYVDDVIHHFLMHLEPNAPTEVHRVVNPEYKTTVGELAQAIESFRNSRSTLISERVGNGLMRGLWATWLSFLPPDQFAYAVPSHTDARGTFVELLKTEDCGQFSYFTAHPGVTRGGHYHHTKTEKFLVVRGKARFRFQDLQTGAIVERFTESLEPEIVESIPGWAHDITNMGDEEMVVLLWASEQFDRMHPDTYTRAVPHG